MLKDLDERQQEQQVNHQGVMPAPIKQSSKKPIVITAIVVLSINIVAFFIWQLYQENQSLKSTKINNKEISRINELEKPPQLEPKITTQQLEEKVVESNTI